MDSLIVAGIVAAFFALALEVVPGLRDAWDKAPSKAKPLVVLGLSLGVPFALVGLACFGIDVQSGAVCPAEPAQGIADTLLLGVSAFSASQVTHAVVGSDLSSRIAYRDYKAGEEEAAG